MRLHNRRLVSMNIVNQLFDLAEVPVEKRQEVNDQADDFVFLMLSKEIHSGRSPEGGAV